jgi:hypothetical protein
MLADRLGLVASAHPLFTPLTDRWDATSLDTGRWDATPSWPFGPPMWRGTRPSAVAWQR